MSVVSAKRKFLLLAVLIMGALLRLILMGRVPYGMNQDEASIGYDAWTLLNYGIDRNGYPWPVYPITWGSGGGSPLMVYLSVIATALFGRSVASVRFFPALLGALTPVMMALFAAAALRLSKKEGCGDGYFLVLAAAFIAAVNPWHIMMSRWALDSNTLPFFHALALFVFAAAASFNGRRRTLLYALSAALFALLPYSYGSATIVAPAALVVMAAFCIKTGKMKTGELIVSVVTFILLLGPLILFFAVNYLGLDPIVTPWFSVPVFTAKRGVFAATPNGVIYNIKNNAGYLLKFLTVGVQDGEMASMYIPGFAQFYRFTFPLTFMGLAVSAVRLKRDKNAADMAMLTNFFVTIIFSLFIELAVNRLVLLLVPMLYFQGLGLWLLYKKKHIISAAVAAALLVSLFLFSRKYYGDYYREYARENFMPGYLEAVAAADELSGEDGEVISTYTWLSAPFMLTLYETRTPPDVFMDTVKWKDESAEFRIAYAFGKYTFGLPDDPNDTPEDAVLIVHESEVDKYIVAGRELVGEWGKFALMR